MQLVKKTEILDKLSKLPETFSLESLLLLIFEDDENLAFTKGEFEENEKPSDLKNIWENDKRNAKKIREEAWQNTNIYLKQLEIKYFCLE